MLPADTRLLADGEALAAAACRLIVDAAQEAIRERRIFRLVLAGGCTPASTYRQLARARQDWAAWEIFWGDERCLPVDHPDRNSAQAQQAWLAHVPIPAAQVYIIPAELGAEPAAAAYARTIADRLPFDLVVLGMGEDGHTASLFPGSPGAAGLVIPVHGAAKAPAERVSLNYPSLRACRRQLILVGGTGKAAALAAWRHGDPLPIAQAASDNACLLVDTRAVA